MQTKRHRVIGTSVVFLICWSVAALAQAPQAGDKPAAAPPAGEKPADAGPVKAKIGSPAPEFTLKDCCDNKFALADYKDKVLVLEWINKDCPYSMAARPVIAKLIEKYKDKGVVWQPIESSHFRKAAENQEFVKQDKLPFHILLDTDGAIGRMYGAKTTPHIYVINKGVLVYAGALSNDKQGDKPKDDVRNYVDEALEATLAGKTVPVAETAAWGCPVKYKEGAKGPGPKDAPADKKGEDDNKGETPPAKP